MKRVSGTIILSVNQSNPNGNPDWDNTPRQYGENIGFMTPMCIKRKIRDVLADHESPCFLEISKKLKINKERFHIFESKNRGFSDLTQKEATDKAVALAIQNRDAFLDKYWDYRLLGGIATETKDSKSEESDEEDKPKTKGKKDIPKKETKKQRFVNTGCLVVSPAVSVAPIEVIEETLSKKAPLTDKEQDLAPAAYKFVRHGIYVANFTVNPHVAHHTKATEEDLKVLKETLIHAFRLSMANARPKVWPLYIWWREHTTALGSFNEYQWFKQLQPTVKIGVTTPTKDEDYIFPDGSKFGAIDLMETAWKE